jgi:hypothetical protein
MQVESGRREEKSESGMNTKLGIWNEIYLFS